MRKILTKITVVVSIALFIVSCANWADMVKRFGEVKFKVTPETLEVVNDQVEFSVQVTIPPKYFAKGVVVKATPYLKYGEETLELEPKTFQGETAKGNGQVISYVNGGTVNYDGKFEYKKAMAESELWVKLEGSDGDKSGLSKDVKLAYGISDVYRPIPTVNNVLPVVFSFVRDYNIPLEEDILYLINSSQVRSSQVLDEKYKVFLDSLKQIAKKYDHLSIQGVNVAGFASPDGPLKVNDPLSKARAKTATNAVKAQLRRRGIKGVEITNEGMGEDWIGFTELVEESPLKDKQMILRILSQYSDPEVRDEQLKNIATIYSELKGEVWPKLRRSVILADIFFKGKTDEQISQMAVDSPEKLSPEELLQASRIVTTPEQKGQILKSANKIHDDWRLKNDMAVVEVQSGNITVGSTLFNNANAGAPDAIVLNNLGVIAMMKGNVAEGQKLIDQAYSTNGNVEGIRIDKAMVDIQKGQFSQAEKMVKGGISPYITALVQLHSNKLDEAANTLKKADAGNMKAAYLSAVVAARQGNDADAVVALKKAIELNPDYKAKAKNDVEFRKLKDNADFSALVN